jgi:hypothetical protein
MAAFPFRLIARIIWFFVGFFWKTAAFFLGRVFAAGIGAVGGLFLGRRRSK